MKHVFSSTTTDRLGGTTRPQAIGFSPVIARSSRFFQVIAKSHRDVATWGLGAEITSSPGLLVMTVGKFFRRSPSVRGNLGFWEQEITSWLRLFLMTAGASSSGGVSRFSPSLRGVPPFSDIMRSSRFLRSFRGVRAFSRSLRGVPPFFSVIARGSPPFSVIARSLSDAAISSHRTQITSLRSQ